MPAVSRTVPSECFSAARRCPDDLSSAERLPRPKEHPSLRGAAGEEVWEGGSSRGRLRSRLRGTPTRWLLQRFSQHIQFEDEFDSAEGSFPPAFSS
jgi:hypothetical protein